MQRFLSILILTCALWVTVIGVSVGSEPPRLAYNGAAGVMEAVDTAADGRIRHTIELSDGGREVALVSSASGQGPGLVIDGDGNSWVAWWSDDGIGQVFIAKRTLQTGVWSPEVQLSWSGEDSRSPALIHQDGVVRVAYEIWNGPTISIVLGGVIDNPEPIPSFTPIAESLSAGDIDLHLHAEVSSLWITWVEGVDDICWTEFDPNLELWSTTACLPLVGKTHAAVRREIRDLVITN